MRLGHNPLANSSLPPLPAIIACVITHLPNRQGYHEHRFEVIKRSIDSLIEGTERHVALYVWDNGSDREFRTWLMYELKPDFLTLSENIGKARARTAMIRSFPLDTILCFSDDDILFEKGWLMPQLELLYGFPDVGMVSGCPIRTMQRWGNQTTIHWASQNAKLTTGRFIPDEWERDFALSIGREIDRHFEDSEKDQDFLIEYNDLKAYAMAHHMQFICLAGRLAKLEYWPSKAMRAEKAFDIAVNNLGLLRLTTTERYVQHIGNVLEFA